MIETLSEKVSHDVIILDDAFQHRRVSAGLNILTTNYDAPFFSNRLLPAGTLRDLKSRAATANIIVVSKTPDHADEEQKKAIKRSLAVTALKTSILRALHTARQWPATTLPQRPRYATTMRWWRYAA